MTLFKDLLKSNQDLRQELSSVHSDLHSSDLEKRSLFVENQSLRDKLENLRSKIDSAKAFHQRLSGAAELNTKGYASTDFGKGINSKQDLNMTFSGNQAVMIQESNRLNTPDFDKYLSIRQRSSIGLEPRRF